MTILVTGGAGYIGSTVAQQLLAAGHDVTIYDNLSSGHLAAVPAAATFVRGDTLDRAALDATLARAGFEAILHFAAREDLGFKAIVGSQSVQRGGDAVELGGRRGCKELLRLMRVHRRAGLEIDDQDAPMRGAIALPLRQFLDPRRQHVLPLRAGDQAGEIEHRDADRRSYFDKFCAHVLDKSLVSM